MSMPTLAPAPKPTIWVREVRMSLVFASLMLAIPLAIRLAARFGWQDAAGLKDRALMVVMGAFIASIGNDIPKRITARICADADPVRVQAFNRFAGWTWVLAGVVLGAAWVALPSGTASACTLVALPLAMALTVGGWFRLRSRVGRG